MNKREQYLEYINQYFEDKKHIPLHHGEYVVPEESLKKKILDTGSATEFVEILKNIILEKEEYNFFYDMLWFLGLFLNFDIFHFKTDLLFSVKTREIKLHLIGGLRHYFFCDNLDEFERLTLDERKEYLKKLDQIEEIPTKLKEFKKLVKARIEKFGHVQLPRLEITRELAKA